MHYFITGVAGFIGSRLADSLLAQGAHVTGVDDLSLGRLANLDSARRHGAFDFLELDMSRPANAVRALRWSTELFGVPDIAWHMAANSDIAAGSADATRDFNRTLETTFALLEAGRAEGLKRLAFASTSAVYGNRQEHLAEDSGPLLPISNYGAAKLASEALISAAAESFLERIWIFRFPNVVGPRATHGVIFDLLARLAASPPSLRVLGDGTQTKPYLHVDELIDAMRFIVERAGERRNVYNIGPEGAGTSVKFIAEAVVERAAPGTPLAYTGGDRGWVGDVPRFQYSTERLARLGWKPRLSSDQAILRAIEELAPAAVAR
ncbi:MAG TPA: NAD-dependent epimerase/dehydratase family protein [Usitatibacter sp.]|nr:NAD-dependent epimerase/dehydratase family protein [Usitatibacter sp.]